MRFLSLARLLLSLTFLSVMIYRLGPRAWLARQQPWEWGMAAAVLVIFALLIAIQKIREPTVWFTIAWFIGGLAATAGCAWLCWYTWRHPANRNWHAIPVIFALGISAACVFWYPLLSTFSQSNKLINRLERAIETSDANADRYLFEARQVVGSGTKYEQTYLDGLERRLRSLQGRLPEPSVPLS
jgi:hypothetical protein